MATPNVDADQIVMVSCPPHNSLRQVRVSVNPHPTDRGTGSGRGQSFAVLAGAERVEGTLFGKWPEANRANGRSE